MITTAAWILLAVVSVILVLAVAALFWTPPEPADRKMNSFSSSKSIQNEDKKEEHAWKIRRYLQEMQIRWKDLDLMMEKQELNDCLIFHWKGLHGKKIILFSITEEQAGEALLEAVSELNNASLIPDIDFYISIPLTDDAQLVSIELLQWMKQKSIHCDFVLADSDGLKDMPGLDGIQAVIGTGTKASVLYEVRGDSSESDWMASLKAENLMKPQWNEQAERMYASIRKKLPWQIRMEHNLPFWFHNKAMKDLMIFLPDTRNWFLPEIDRRGDHLYLSANDEKILEEAEKKIETSAQNSQVHLNRVSEHRIQKTADVKDDHYRMISEACRNSAEVGTIIPVLLDRQEKDSDFAPLETIYFAPLESGKRISARGSVSFYENVLRRGTVNKRR